MATAGGRPSRDDVRDRLIGLIHAIAKIPRESIVDSAAIDAELEMNSLVFVELQVAIEDEYGILLDPIQVVELNRFGAVVDYIHHCVLGARQ